MQKGMPLLTSLLFYFETSLIGITKSALMFGGISHRGIAR